MKTDIGGDRIGSGNKNQISNRHFNRSTHDLDFAWRSSMAAGTLVPFMCMPMLPADKFDIDLACDVITLPTVGPLFGSFKVQLDVYKIPMKLYIGKLYMNKLEIGLKMETVFLPQVELRTYKLLDFRVDTDDNSQINSSCLLKYLGISGLGTLAGVADEYTRLFNALGLLAYWDIYKNYYANKQEERGFAIHIDANTLLQDQEVLAARVYEVVNGEAVYLTDMLDNGFNTPASNNDLIVVLDFGYQAQQVSWDKVNITVDLANQTADQVFSTWTWGQGGESPIGELNPTMSLTLTGGTPTSQHWIMPNQNPVPNNPNENYTPTLVEFPLSHIDKMREAILADVTSPSAFIINSNADFPYSMCMQDVNDESKSMEYSQEGLGIKTYQSDLFNNWISTEYIDGPNGINELTKVSTTGDAFTIDALNIANKVYNMLNRIAISGGTYYDWIEAVYTRRPQVGMLNPIYVGGLIKELGFEQVISTADTNVNDNTQPLGTLGGRGRLTNKHKGGRIRVSADGEPCYLMGLVSLTPRVDYSQGNVWDVNLKTMDDFHKPDLDGIGFQDLITEQMAWQDTRLELDGTVTMYSAGKVPAWINYMTNVNRTYGNFAERNKDMFMTLNRRYDIGINKGRITDLTTYIDPTKFNFIFAQTDLTAQNFWVQIGARVTARRLMSAKMIPNL